MPTVVAAVVLLCAALAAQAQVYVVDAAGRRGTDFRDLAAAIAAAADGSVLVVRDGAYGCVDIAGKGLTLLCDGRVTAGAPADDAPFLCVRDTTPQQVVLVRGLQSGNGRGLSVIAAGGPVTIDGVGTSLVLRPDAGPAIVVQASKQVTVRELVAEGNCAAELTDSVVAFEQCRLRGTAARSANGEAIAGAPAVWASNSNVQIVHTALTGGHGLAQGDDVLAAGAAVVLAASNLRAVGTPAHPIAGGNDPVRGPRAPIVGIGAARVAPTIPLATALVDEPGILLSRPLLPAVLSAPAQPGGVLEAVRHGSPDTLCAVAISVRGPHKPLPALSDPLWVQDTTYCIESLGRASDQGLFRVTKRVPADPTLRGYQVVWQSADIGPNGVVAVSNPSASYVY